MTDKEKEAIEEIGLIIESFYNFPNPISIDLKDKDVKFLETVLNLIQTQQAEIEKYKYLYQKALDNTIKSDRELFNKKAEIEKKDKMIEYMANFINTPYTKDTSRLENERGERNTKYTEKYFERKIK